MARIAANTIQRQWIRMQLLWLLTGQRDLRRVVGHY